MKTIKTILAICLAAFLFSSCAHSVYPITSLCNNYNAQMTSEEELAIKEQVNIYFNEKDVDGEYQIISLNTYKPFCLLPFHSLQVKKMTKKFLAKAVLKAYEEGGNAILVKSAGFFYVLKLENWVANNSWMPTFVNPIFDTKLSEEIQSGALASMEKKDRARAEKAFIDEIESNIENIVTLEEVEAVRRKIAILSEYNSKLEKPKKSYQEAIEDFTDDCNSIEKKINREAAKKAKEEAKKAEKKSNKK